jgi:hypothetical protein
VRPVLLILPLFLVACSSERVLALQERQWSEVDHEARGLVHNGMPVAEAVPALTGAGYACSASSEATPHVDCTRQRRLSWTIASCIERVTFTGTGGEGGTVADLAVPKPACIGTP